MLLDWGVHLIDPDFADLYAEDYKAVLPVRAHDEL